MMYRYRINETQVTGDWKQTREEAIKDAEKHVSSQAVVLSFSIETWEGGDSEKSDPLKDGGTGFG